MKTVKHGGATVDVVERNHAALAAKILQSGKARAAADCIEKIEKGGGYVDTVAAREKLLESEGLADAILTAAGYVAPQAETAKPAAKKAKAKK